MYAAMFVDVEGHAFLIGSGKTPEKLIGSLNHITKLGPDEKVTLENMCRLAFSKATQQVRYLGVFGHVTVAYCFHQ